MKVKDAHGSEGAVRAATQPRGERHPRSYPSITPFLNVCFWRKADIGPAWAEWLLLTQSGHSDRPAPNLFFA